MNNKRKWTDDQLKAAVISAKSFREVLRTLGMAMAGGNYVSMHAAIARLNLDTSHWLGQAHLRGKTHDWSNKRTFEELLVENCPSYQTNDIKRRLIKEGVLVNQCAGTDCGVIDWLGKPIVLHLDHINGVRTDFRKENLQLLCPNCHSQTSTYCGKNKKKR